jgi:hypothetical protein
MKRNHEQTPFQYPVTAVILGLLITTAELMRFAFQERSYMS